MIEIISCQYYKKFLSYYPLKQGLKLVFRARVIPVPGNFYPTIH